MRLEDLERELRADRPEPELDFARRLDEWAEAGFPRDRGLGPRTASRTGALRRAWDRLSATPPRRILLPAGALATAVVVAGVAISQNGSDSPGLVAPTQPQSQSTKPAAPPPVTSAESAAGAERSLEAVPPPAASDEYNLTLPAPQKPSAGAGVARDSGGIARGTDQRIVDATARITLGAPADEVQDVANGVVDVTDHYQGVVLDSQVTSDQAGARASFELEIPFKQLDAALTDLSGLADVISRTEAGEDITARAVRARKDLANTLDQIRKARIELIKADTREQRLVIKSQIASLQATADAHQAALNGVRRQGRFATVGVEVTSNGPTTDDGNWSLGDALHDAGRVLEVIGGIALVTLAILLPVSLIAALIAFAVSRSRRRARENALDS
jgi:hypothetical protein